MTIFSIRTLPAAVAATLLGLYCAAPAYCDDYPANSLRAGLYSVFYHVSAENLQGPYVPPGANIDAKNVETLYLAYVRSLTPNLDFELTAGYPPLQKTVGKGPATLGSVPYNGQVIATARWIAPTALIEYVFFDPGAKLRPFIGAGVNYTTFYDRDSTAAGDAASGGPTKLSLTRSIGPAGSVGLAWNLGSNWHMYGSYNISRVNTDLTADTAGVIRTTHIKFGPQTLVVSLGYSF
jgi:outer membrane protein